MLQVEQQRTSAQVSRDGLLAMAGPFPCAMPARTLAASGAALRPATATKPAALTGMGGATLAFDAKPAGLLRWR